MKKAYLLINNIYFIIILIYKFNNIKVINLHNSINENSDEDEYEYEKNKKSNLAQKLIQMMNKK